MARLLQQQHRQARLQRRHRGLRQRRRRPHNLLLVGYLRKERLTGRRFHNCCLQRQISESQRHHDLRHLQPADPRHLQRCHHPAVRQSDSRAELRQLRLRGPHRPQPQSLGRHSLAGSASVSGQRRLPVVLRGRLSAQRKRQSAASQPAGQRHLPRHPGSRHQADQHPDVGSMVGPEPLHLGKLLPRCPDQRQAAERRPHPLPRARSYQLQGQRHRG